MSRRCTGLMAMVMESTHLALEHTSQSLHGMALLLGVVACWPLLDHLSSRLMSIDPEPVEDA